MKQDWKEEQLKKEYFQLIINNQQEQQQQQSGGIESENKRNTLSDKVEATNVESSSSPHPIFDNSILNAWKQAASFSSNASTQSALSSNEIGSSVSSLDDSENFSISNLLASFLHSADLHSILTSAANRGNAQGRVDDSPLYKLYRFLCVKHTEHAIHLHQQDAEFTSLRNKQSKEMEIVCQQAQQSEIDAASTGHIESSGYDPYRDHDTDILSDSIPSLVQSHLHETRTLEDSFELEHHHWLKSQRQQLYTYLRNLRDEHDDVSQRRLELHALMEHDRRVESYQQLTKKMAKILRSDEEEKELEATLARHDEEETDGSHKSIMRQVRIFETERKMERHTTVDENYYRLLNNASNLDAPTDAGNIASKDGDRPSYPMSSNVISAAPLSATLPSNISIQPPFPIRSLLAFHPLLVSTSNQVESHSRGLTISHSPSTNEFRLFLTDDPLFTPTAVTEGTNTTNSTNSTTSFSSIGTSKYESMSPSPSSSTIPSPHSISTSPLISYHTFLSHMDSYFGRIGPGGLTAMVLPHHSSPLLHAYPSLGEIGTGSELTDDEAKLIRNQREFALQQFNHANTYVKNWLQYGRNQTDLLEQEFGVQIQVLWEAIQKELSLNQVPSSLLPDPATFLSHGDILLTRHTHALNAQLCIHVNVQPRRGGARSTTATHLSSSTFIHSNIEGSQETSGVKMTEEEARQQVSQRLDTR